MKRILKVLLVMGWSLKLFASENNTQFLALYVLNTPATKDLVTIIRDQRTNPGTKVAIFSRVVNGLTITDEEEIGILFELRVLRPIAPQRYNTSSKKLTDEDKAQIRNSVMGICTQLNIIIKRLEITHDFLPATNEVGLSAGQIVATIAFIKLFVGKGFHHNKERRLNAIDLLETTSVENIIQAYAP